MSDPIEVIKQKLIELEEKVNELKKLILELKTVSCTLCGGNDHISKDCIDTQPETQDDRDFHDVDDDDSDCDEEEDYKPFFCYRCGRRGHYAIQCHASTHANGDDLDGYTDHYDSE